MPFPSKGQILRGGYLLCAHIPARNQAVSMLGLQTGEVRPSSGLEASSPNLTGILLAKE